MDLHIHSNISADSKYSVEEILTFAEIMGLDCISITDHNSVLAHQLIKNINVERYYNGKIISGIEIDTVYKGITFDVLGYDFNVDKVQDWAYKKFGTLEQRQTILRDKLLVLCDKNNIKYDKDFEWNAKKEFAHLNVFRNISQYSENKEKLGFDIQSGSDFYRNSTMNKEFILYMDMNFLWADLNEVEKVLHSNGGKMFLAHPYGYGQKIDTEVLLNIAIKNGFDGVEVYHSKHTDEQIKYLEQFCKQNNLLMSGGSDFHGKIGEHLIDNNKIKI